MRLPHLVPAGAAVASAALATSALAATPFDVDWTSPETVSNSGTSATRPQITMSADGARLSAVWTQSSEIWGAGSGDGGATWSVPTRLSVNGVTTDFPQVVASRDGLKANAIWYTFSPAEAVTTAASTDGGKTWGNRVTRLLGLATGNPQIAASADGSRVAAVWSYDNPTIRVVEVSTSATAGVSWVAPVPMSDITKNAGDVSVSMSDDGRHITVVYTQSDGVDDLVHARTSTDGGENWNPPEVLSDAGQSAGSPQVAVAADGSRTHVSWTRYDGSVYRVQVTTSTDSGETWTSPANLSDPGQDATTTDLAASRDGRLASVVWKRSDGSQERIQSTSTADGGANWIAPVTHSAAGFDADNPRVVTSADGRTVTAAWYRLDGSNNVVESIASADGGQSWGPVVPLSDPAQPAEDPDLASADGRRVVAAWNGSDGSDNRVWESVGVLRTVPDAPTGASAAPGDATVNASWTAPADDGGAPVTGYTATATPGGQTCSTAGTSCTIAGLSNGTSYTVSVRAANALGTGPASAASNPVTPAAAATPAPAPAPTPGPTPTPDPPTTKVIAKPNDKKSKLKVKVKPDLGTKKQWEFVVKFKKKDDWKTVKTKKGKTKVYETEGPDHKLTIDLDEGKYKAKSKAARGYEPDTSDVVKLKK